MDNNVLIIGSGGREHAIAWKLKQSPKVKKLYIAPGNAGTSASGENVALDITDNNEVVTFAKKHKIDLVVVAPDDPLAGGMVDKLIRAGILAFGPVQGSAKLEWAKSFAKQLMKEEEIPTARFETFTDYKKAKTYLGNQPLPVVVKASGLALGKGVTVARSREEAEKALEDIMVKKIFGTAGEEVVIEEFLEGQEVSFHAFCDGETAQLFPVAQDHKPIFDGDKGPNTGGMGTIAPVPWVRAGLIADVDNMVIRPVLAAMKKRGVPFQGCLYPGLMITKGGPKVLEFNARFGDPETQSYLRLLKTDLFDIFTACAKGTLSKIDIQWENKTACCIVIASAGYPASSQKGIPIRGIEDAEKDTDVVVFHAATKKQDNTLLTNGGRVLGVTAVGKSLDEALQKAYSAVKKITFEGMQYRTDIGRRVKPDFI